MAGSLVPQTIVLALGAGALGGPDALRLLLQFAGRNPAVDLAVCVVVISLLTAPVLGTMLLARFVRKARAVPGGGAPAATDLFAHVTATVSIGAAFLVTACLLAVPGGGGLGGAVSLPIHFAVKNSNVVTVLTICVVVVSLVTALLLGTMQLGRFFRKLRRAGGGGGAAPAATDLFAQMTAVVSVGAAFLVTVRLLVMPGGGGGGVVVRLPIDFAVKNSNVVTVLTICAGFAAGGFLPCAVHLRRFLRGAGGAGGPAPAGRFTTTIKFVAVAAMSLAASFVASGGFDAQLLFPQFHSWGKTMVTLPVGVAIVTVAGTILLVRCSRRARNAAGAARTS